MTSAAEETGIGIDIGYPLPSSASGHADYNFNYAPRHVWQLGDPLIIAVGRRGGLILDRVPPTVTCLSIVDRSAASK